jgi:hypothetical protein
MITQQTIGIGICNRLDILGVEPHEVVVITLIDKQVFPVITPVVDMIVLAKLEWNGFGHMKPPI